MKATDVFLKIRPFISGLIENTIHTKIRLREQSGAPDTPLSGSGSLYCLGSDGHIYWKDDAGNVYDLTAGTAPSGGGAPETAQYVVIDLDATLTAERKLTAGSGIGITDGGANGNVTLALGALSGDWDAGSYEIRAQTFESDVATGTAPLVVASTTVVGNLNADTVDGIHGTAFAQGSGTATRVAFWSDTDEISSSANLYWDNSNNRLGIGTAAPDSKLHVMWGDASVTGYSDAAIFESAANVYFQLIAGTNTDKKEATISFGYGGASPNLLAGAIKFNSANAVEGLDFCISNATKGVLASTGYWGFGLASPDGTVHVQASAANVVALTVQGYSGQTENLQEWTTSADGFLASMSATGGFLASTVTGGLVSASYADAVIDAVTNVLFATHNSTGTTAAGFGTGLEFAGQYGDTEDGYMGRIRAVWEDVSTPKAKLVFGTWNDSAYVDGMYLGSDGVLVHSFGVKIHDTGGLYLYSDTGVTMEACIEGGTLFAGGDASGYADMVGVTNVSDLTANSTGVGTIKFKDATARDSAGFIKIYIGVTEYYVPVFAAITS